MEALALSRGSAAEPQFELEQPTNLLVGGGADVGSVRESGQPVNSLQVVVSELTSDKKKKQEESDKRAECELARASKLHEWLAREIKSKLEQQHSDQSTGAITDKRKGSSNLLSALIEGRKSWSEQRTVIVDIKNGRQVLEKAKVGEAADEKQLPVAISGQLDSLSSEPEAEKKQSKTLAAKKASSGAKISSGKQLNTSKQEEEAANKSETGNREAHKEEETRKEAEESRGAQKGEQKSEKFRERLFGSSGGAKKEAKGERIQQKPPSFGLAPYKLSRLPYFSYYGKARNVELVSSADRKAADREGRASESIAEQERGSEGSSKSESSGSLRSAVSSPSSSSKIPTLTRSVRGNQSEIDLEDSRELELSKRNQRNGYSNISNLFPGQPMSVRERRREREQQKHFESSRANRIRFGSEQRNSNSNSNRQPTNSSSLVNLNAKGRYSPATSNNNEFHSGMGLSTFNRRNSLTNNNYSNTYGGRNRNRSMNSLNTSPYSNASDHQQIAASTMRRQNSQSGYTSSVANNKLQRPPSGAYQSARPSSSAGYLSRHGRSPSASSLLYATSPYGQPALDPDCPVHGYSPVGGAAGGLSKSSQHLAPDADLLYEPYSPSFYERPSMGGAAAPVVATPAPAGGSLYSPNSPAGQRSAYASPLSPNLGVAAANSSGRLAQASPSAYYNGSSRFSMYHSPAGGAGGPRSSLAPTNEQLRRILGYQPHTKPIYLHPQWAYSRPFIHLQGTRSPSPSSPMEGEPDELIRPRFEPYNQLQDTQAIRAVDFHPSGEVYAIGSNSRALRICAYPADYELRHFGQDHVTTAPRILFKFLQVHRGSIYCVGFNATGQLLATGSNDQTVHIVRYNSITHSPDGDEYRLTMHDGTVRDLCFIDDQSNGSSLLLSAGGGDNKIYVTDCDTITPFQSMAGHTQMIMALHHWAGANFVSASYDRTVRFWDLRTRACTAIVSAPPTRGTAGKWGGPGAPVCAVKVDSSGRLLATGHTDSTCMLYDIRGARIIQAFKPHDDEIRTISFSPKSYYLLTGGYDGRIVLSDLQGDLTQPLPSVCVAESDDKIVQSKWHPSDFTFVTTSADKTATLWAMPTE